MFSRRAAAALVLMALPALGVTQTPDARGLAALKPDDLLWLPVPQTTDGRERAVLWGNPESGGDWVYRVRVPKPIRVAPHTHPVEEVITVLEGRWSLGLGTRFETSQLVVYPPGSFVRIPANTPHFIATGDGPVVIQSSGSGVFATVPIRASGE